MWAAAPALVEWLTSSEDRRQLYLKRSVLELGAGLGMVGMALSISGAQRVLLTDLPQQQPLLQLNITQNPAARHVAAAACWPLGWSLRLGSLRNTQRNVCHNLPCELTARRSVS